VSVLGFKEGSGNQTSLGKMVIFAVCYRSVHSLETWEEFVEYTKIRTGVDKTVSRLAKSKSMKGD